MQNPQNVDHLLPLVADAKQHEVPATPPDMQGHHARNNVVAEPDARDAWTGLETRQRGNHQGAIPRRLSGAEPPRSPAQDLVIVGLGKANRPDLPRHPDDRPRTFPARIVR